MRILFLHNRYQQRGGEDTVVDAEVAMLKAGGVEVETLFVNNDDITGGWAKLTTAATATYNPKSRDMIARVLKEGLFDAVHVHNFFPRLSPAVFDACQKAGVPVVWTLHNYRVTCAGAYLMRDGRICTDCVGKMPLGALKHRCYRGSLAGSATVAGLIGYHRLARTWHTKVDRFIALTGFARHLFIKAGLPADKIAIKPNFIADPGAGAAGDQRKGFVFIGRFSPEKGLKTLLEAWRGLDIPLTVIGDGPEAALIEVAVAENPAITWLGNCDRATIFERLKTAQALILPSIWVENFPMTLIEAMACATPVIASDIGALPSLIRDGEDGLLFAPGNPAALRACVISAAADPQKLSAMGIKARRTYEARLTPQQNFSALTAIYRDAIATKAKVA